jgi:hypothetical protein
MSSRVRRTAGAIVWLVVAIIIALGAAGIATGMNHRPSTEAQRELTAAGDAEVKPLLDAAASDLARLADDVGSLGTEARAALAALNGTDPTTAEAAVAAGDEVLGRVLDSAASIRSTLSSVPYVGTPTAGIHLSDLSIARHAALLQALDATEGLDEAWLRLTTGAVAATRMSALLAEHDRLVNEAVERGRLARYKAAISRIDEASAQLDRARVQRDQLANTVDVSVLDDWIARNAAYDKALRDLYQVIPKVRKKVTAKVQAAVKAEAEARSRLPPDTRGLVIIMADIGRGGMNGAVIAIEEARAALTDALEAGAAESDGS